MPYEDPLKEYFKQNPEKKLKLLDKKIEEESGSLANQIIWKNYKQIFEFFQPYS